MGFDRPVDGPEEDCGHDGRPPGARADPSKLRAELRAVAVKAAGRAAHGRVGEEAGQDATHDPADTVHAKRLPRVVQGM